MERDVTDPRVMETNSIFPRYWKAGVANVSSTLISWTTHWPNWPTAKTASLRQTKSLVPHHPHRDYPGATLSNGLKRTANDTNGCENAAGSNPSHIHPLPNYPFSLRSSHSTRTQATRTAISQTCLWISSSRTNGKPRVTGTRTTTRQQFRKQIFVLENRFFSLLLDTLL